MTKGDTGDLDPLLIWAWIYSLNVFLWVTPSMVYWDMNLSLYSKGVTAWIESLSNLALNIVVRIGVLESCLSIIAYSESFLCIVSTTILPPPIYISIIILLFNVSSLLKFYLLSWVYYVLRNISSSGEWFNEGGLGDLLLISSFYLSSVFIAFKQPIEFPIPLLPRLDLSLMFDTPWMHLSFAELFYFCSDLDTMFVFSTGDGILWR